jgi:hypothetical protein
MNQVVDVFLMALGSLSFGVAAWLVAHFTLSRWWTRRWLLNRLLGASPQSNTQAPQNLGSVADMLDAIAREVHSGTHSRWHLLTLPNASPTLHGGQNPLQCNAFVVTH